MEAWLTVLGLENTAALAVVLIQQGRLPTPSFVNHSSQPANNSLAPLRVVNMSDTSAGFFTGFEKPVDLLGAEVDEEDLVELFGDADAKVRAPRSNWRAL